VFEDTYSHEKFITESIENIMKIAIEENDFATQNLLNWFIEEQVEEEKNSFELIEKLNSWALMAMLSICLTKSLEQEEHSYLKKI